MSKRHNCPHMMSGILNANLMKTIQQHRTETHYGLQEPGCSPLDDIFVARAALQSTRREMNRERGAWVTRVRLYE